MAVAECHFRKDDNREMMRYTNRVIEVLANKPRPGELSEDEWTKLSGVGGSELHGRSRRKP
jgi:hypothetical protein